MRIIVLFDLRPGTEAADYESWAMSTDLPIVRGLPSISGYEIFKTTGLLGSDASPPYQYIEIIDVEDMDLFGTDIASDTMQKVAAEFQSFADNPVFLTTKSLGERP